MSQKSTSSPACNMWHLVHVSFDRVEKKERSRNRSVKFSSSSEEALMRGSTSESSTDAVYTYEPVTQTWSKFICVTFRL